MTTEPTPLDAQLRLSALLRYRQKGDYAVFSSLVDLAYGRTLPEHPLWHANLLFAYDIAGLCDVSAALGRTHWTVSHKADVNIPSIIPKVIGATEEWCDSRQRHLVPLIRNSEGAALVHGIYGSGNNPTPSIWTRPLTSVVPSFRSTEQHLISEVPFEADAGGDSEVFNVESGRWESGGQQPDCCLRRRPRSYGGVEYFVEWRTTRIRYKVLQPEWAYVVAYHLLPWSRDTIFKVSASDLAIQRPVRLPTLLNRFLFGSCHGVTIGPRVIFHQLNSETASALIDYFSITGKRS